MAYPGIIPEREFMRMRDKEAYGLAASVPPRAGNR